MGKATVMCRCVNKSKNLTAKKKKYYKNECTAIVYFCIGFHYSSVCVGRVFNLCGLSFAFKKLLLRDYVL